jgi:anti-sigma factor ChrR (cupin superfamily)
MSTHPGSESRSACAWSDTAWCYVLASNSNKEDEDFREHLFEGCAECGEELQHARAVVGDLDLAVAQRTLQRGHGSTISKEVRDRLLRECASAKPTPFGTQSDDTAGLPVPTSFSGISLLPESNEGWHPSSVAGVEFKKLVEDPDRRIATALVRMAPGTSYPSHRHGAREECYVLEGDLSFGEHHMTAGDYQVAERGSVHPIQATEKGCLLLIVSSLDDELLEDD